LSPTERDFLDRLDSPTARGGAAERVAMEFLRARGLRPVATNHRNPRGEIDLVALDGDTLCFVEIKARSRAEYGGGAAAVDARKRRRICRAAEVYLVYHPHAGPCRFDVVSLDRENGEWRVTYYPNAFETS
jgi:putative endonuclease